MIDLTGSIAPAAADDYWSDSRRPLTSLVFVVPILAAYELGVLAQGPAAARNGADVWLRGLLDTLGFGQYFLLPTLIVAVLLGWHHTTRQPWRVSRATLITMAVECAGLSVCLWIVLQVQGVLMQMAVGGGATAAISHSTADRLGFVVGYLGAGVYEELLFRLLLLPASALALAGLGLSKTASLAVAAITTSVVFAAAHYVGPYGEPLELFTLLFRFLAGLFFCTLFVTRGFGIAAGTHAGYDILVGVLLAAPRA